MPRIKLNADKLVGYVRTDQTKTGVTKLGTAKLGCTEKATPTPAETNRHGTAR